ncbi:MAG: hypothetical protein IJY71_07110 [Clostridia bacterium]|nr:hypothetical protein [Clostridia bacterium]
MTIYAETYTYRGIWRSDSAYVFAENDPLTVSFGRRHAGDTLSIRGASGVRSLRLDEEGAVEVPLELIKNDTLIMHVERYENGKLIRDFTVDPLTVTVNDGQASALPWTVSIEERLASLENAIFGQSSPIFE